MSKLYWPIQKFYRPTPAANYMFKVKNRNTRVSWKYVQSYQWRNQNDAIGVVLVFLLLILNIFHTLI